MENIDNIRTSHYVKETNNLKENRINIPPNSIDNNSNENENSIGGNTNKSNENIEKKDIKINVFFNCCNTPYFTFGRTLFFYCPNSLKNTDISNEYYSSSVNLSEMPDPPFSIGPECKFI
jgi:hypothetical protein